MLALQADGHEVTTVEALNTARELHPIQQAFADVGALQSGYSSGAVSYTHLDVYKRQYPLLMTTTPTPDPTAAQAVAAEVVAVVVAMVDGTPCVLEVNDATRLPSGPLLEGHRLSLIHI